MHMYDKINYNGIYRLFVHKGLKTKLVLIRRDMLYVHTSSTPPSSHLRIMRCGSVTIYCFADTSQATF